MKRLFDLVLALALILPAILICAVFAVLISIETPGSPLFAQTRVGLNRRPFRMVKLRTMRLGTPNAASHHVSASQITRVGAFIRRCKIDELPQAWNVLTGDMSFIGPRPCLPVQSELIEERSMRGVFSVRPGITGPAQIAGIDMSTPRRLAIADTRCLIPWTLKGDLEILSATFLGAGQGDAVARTA